MEQEEGDVTVVWPESDHEQRGGIPRGRLRIGEIGKAEVDTVGPQRNAAAYGQRSRWPPGELSLRVLSDLE